MKNKLRQMLEDFFSEAQPKMFDIKGTDGRVDSSIRR